jgi:uncharacterized membrane protein YwzB
MKKVTDTQVMGAIIVLSIVLGLLISQGVV